MSYWPKPDLKAGEVDPVFGGMICKVTCQGACLSDGDLTSYWFLTDGVITELEAA